MCLAQNFGGQPSFPQHVTGFKESALPGHTIWEEHYAPPGRHRLDGIYYLVGIRKNSPVRKTPRPTHQDRQKGAGARDQRAKHRHHSGHMRSSGQDGIGGPPRSSTRTRRDATKPLRRVHSRDRAPPCWVTKKA